MTQMPAGFFAVGHHGGGKNAAGAYWYPSKSHGYAAASHHEEAARMTGPSSWNPEDLGDPAAHAEHTATATAIRAHVATMPDEGRADEHAHYDAHLGHLRDATHAFVAATRRHRSADEAAKRAAAAADDALYDAGSDLEEAQETAKGLALGDTDMGITHTPGTSESDEPNYYLGAHHPEVHDAHDFLRFAREHADDVEDVANDPDDPNEDAQELIANVRGPLTAATERYAAARAAHAAAVAAAHAGAASTQAEWVAAGQRLGGHQSVAENLVMSWPDGARAHDHLDHHVADGLQDVDDEGHEEDAHAFLAQAEANATTAHAATRAQGIDMDQLEARENGWEEEPEEEEEEPEEDDDEIDDEPEDYEPEDDDAPMAKAVQALRQEGAALRALGASRRLAKGEAPARTPMSAGGAAPTEDELHDRVFQHRAIGQVYHAHAVKWQSKASKLPKGPEKNQARDLARHHRAMGDRHIAIGHEHARALRTLRVARVHPPHMARLDDAHHGSLDEELTQHLMGGTLLRKARGSYRSIGEAAAAMRGHVLDLAKAREKYSEGRSWVQPSGRHVKKVGGKIVDDPDGEHKIARPLKPGRKRTVQTRARFGNYAVHAAGGDYHVHDTESGSHVESAPDLTSARRLAQQLHDYRHSPHMQRMAVNSHRAAVSDREHKAQQRQVAVQDNAERRKAKRAEQREGRSRDREERVQHAVNQGLTPGKAHPTWGRGRPVEGSQRSPVASHILHALSTETGSAWSWESVLQHATQELNRPVGRAEFDRAMGELGRLVRARVTARGDVQLRLRDAG